MTDTSIRDIIGQLKAWFPPEAHRERDLPGGGKWFYIPWQAIRERFDEVCPQWQCSYSTPIYLGDYCTITCTITIANISKQGVGNAEIQLLSSSGKNMARGTAIERCTADAFKGAAEVWGVARYLDEQTDPKLKAAFIRYMQQHNDGRAAAFNNQNEGHTPKRSPSKSQAKPFGKASLTIAPTPKQPAIITPDQVTRFWAIARQTGYSDVGVRELIGSEGFTSSKEITTDKYEKLCNAAADEVLAAIYNDRAKADVAF